MTTDFQKKILDGHWCISKIVLKYQIKSNHLFIDPFSKLHRLFHHIDSHWNVLSTLTKKVEWTITLTNSFWLSSLCTCCAPTNRIPYQYLPRAGSFWLGNCAEWRWNAPPPAAVTGCCISDGRNFFATGFLFFFALQLSVLQCKHQQQKKK